MKKTDIRKVIFAAITFTLWVVYVKILRVTVDPPVWQYATVCLAWIGGAVAIAIGPAYKWLYPEE